MLCLGLASLIIEHVHSLFFPSIKQARQVVASFEIDETFVLSAMKNGPPLSSHCHMYIATITAG
jgi:hypothetical protein